MFKGPKQFLVRVRDWLTWPVVSALEAQHDLLLRAQWERELRAAKNPLNRFGAKYFSQTDEDGITLKSSSVLASGSEHLPSLELVTD